MPKRRHDEPENLQGEAGKENLPVSQGEAEQEGDLSSETKEEASEQRPVDSPKEAEEQRGEEEEGKSLKDKLKKKDTEVKLLKQEKEELRDQYLRALAEMENMRKRLEREKSDFFQYAHAELLKEFLIVADNFERALATEEEVNGKSFREGVEMIYRQYMALLKNKGVVPIEIAEHKFDPNFHQAVLTEESLDADEPRVSEVLQKGYTLHERLLRPALVKVVVPKKM